MAKPPTNGEYLALAREWKKFQEKYLTAKMEKTRQKALRNRNRIAEKVILGMKLLILRKVNRIIYDEELRQDAYNEACFYVAIKALPKWNEEKAAAAGAKFITYMMLWVTNAIYRTRDKDTLVKIPINLRSKVLKRKAMGMLEPGDQFLLPTHTGWDLPLNRENGGCGDHPLGEYLVYHRGKHGNDAATEKLYLAQLQAKLIVTISELPQEKQREVMTSRLEGETLQSIGNRLGLSRERIRQIEANCKKILTGYIQEQQKKEEQECV